MSDPITNICVYCGSPDVMDDAWWCSSPACWDNAEEEAKESFYYEARTPLTRIKAISDLGKTQASIWGHDARYIELMAGEIAKLAKAPMLIASSWRYV